MTTYPTSSHTFDNQPEVRDLKHFCIQLKEDNSIIHHKNLGNSPYTESLETLTVPLKYRDATLTLYSCPGW